MEALLSNQMATAVLTKDGSTVMSLSDIIDSIVDPFIAVIAANWVPLFGLLATILAVSLIWRIVKRKTGA